MALKFSTVAEYFLISIALYIFVLSPILQPYISSGKEEDAVVSYEKSDSLVYPDENLQCEPHTFQSHILSRDPLIIYIPSFLKDEEADEMVKLA